MKLKNILLAILLLSSSSILFSQNFKKDEQVVNFGLGIGATYYSGSFYSTVVPPISISYEKAILDGIFDKGVIGVGGYFGYSASKFSSNIIFGNYSSSITNIFIGARGSLHYPIIDEPKLDTYAGLTLGWWINSWSNSSVYYSATGGGFYPSFHAGAHYYFTDQWSGMAEIGYGVAYLNIGVGYKF